MKRSCIGKLTCAACVLLGTHMGVAQAIHKESDIESLLSMSLEELMDVEVYTASQETDYAAESPAIISVITAEQLKQWGIISLHDAFSLLPGIVKSDRAVARLLHWKLYRGWAQNAGSCY